MLSIRGGVADAGHRWIQAAGLANGGDRNALSEMTIKKIRLACINGKWDPATGRLSAGVSTALVAQVATGSNGLPNQNHRSSRRQ